MIADSFLKKGESLEAPLLWTSRALLHQTPPTGLLFRLLSHHSLFQSSLLLIVFSFHKMPAATLILSFLILASYVYANTYGSGAINWGAPVSIKKTAQPQVKSQCSGAGSFIAEYQGVSHP